MLSWSLLRYVINCLRNQRPMQISSSDLQYQMVLYRKLGRIRGHSLWQYWELQGILHRWVVSMPWFQVVYFSSKELEEGMKSKTQPIAGCEVSQDSEQSPKAKHVSSTYNRNVHGPPPWEIFLRNAQTSRQRRLQRSVHETWEGDEGK